MPHVISLARIPHDSTSRWIISADRHAWIYLDTLSGINPQNLPQAVAAVNQLPQNWPLLRRGHAINPRKLMAPVVSPGKIIGVAANYAQHGAEVGLPDSGRLRLFAKFPSAITGPMSTVIAHAQVTTQLDYEAELAVIVGRRVPAGERLHDPMSVVFGYAVANDISARDIQGDGSQLTYAKSMDTFLPIGPWITLHTPSSPPLDSRTITTLVNGVRRQHSSIAQMVRDVPQLIRDITATISLDPGDVILTGSPAGSGVGMQPPQFLKDGDVVSCRITGLGHISNTIRVMHPLERLDQGTQFAGAR